jgi:hypothetical protein
LGFRDGPLQRSGRPGRLIRSATTNYGDDQTYRPLRAFVADAVYKVSARWGFAETPDDIVLACKMIAQHIWDRGQGTFGQVTPAGFVIERDIPPPARLILDNWKRKEFELN